MVEVVATSWQIQTIGILHIDNPDPILDPHVSLAIISKIL